MRIPKSSYSLLLLVCLLQFCTSSEETKKIGKVENSLNNDSRYQLHFGDLTIELDANQGARISSFRLGDRESLSLENIDSAMWGSTFWPSPQNRWGWPPPANLDNEDYSIFATDSSITAIGKIDRTTQFSFNKAIRINKKDTSIVIEYEIINHSDSLNGVAPWEVTRVPPNGLTFYPAKPGSYTAPFTVIDSVNYVWFDFKTSSIPTTNKGKLIGFADVGWVAHIHNRLIYIKKFIHHAPSAYALNEGEIEIYTDPAKRYIEIEPQGAYKVLRPGESYQWEVRWVLRYLPDSIAIEVGNRKLIDFVEALVHN